MFQTLFLTQGHTEKVYESYYFFSWHYHVLMSNQWIINTRHMDETRTVKQTKNTMFLNILLMTITLRGNPYLSLQILIEVYTNHYINYIDHTTLRLAKTNPLTKLLLKWLFHYKLNPDSPTYFQTLRLLSPVVKPTPDHSLSPSCTINTHITSSYTPFSLYLQLLALPNLHHQKEDNHRLSTN